MKRIILLLISIMCFLNCNKEEENQDLTFEGSFNLVKVDGNFSPSITYEKGEVIWTINSDKKTITIKNTVDNYVGIRAVFSNNHSGTYNYTIAKENNLKYLVVDGRKGVINYTNEGLEIDYGLAADDVRYTFKR